MRTVTGLLTIIINLCLVGLVLKMYTEHFKDRKIEARKQ